MLPLHWAAIGAAVLLALAPRAGLGAQTPDTSGALKTGTVEGVIRDSSGVAVSGAEVTIAGLLGRGATDSDGAFRMAGIPTGARVLRVRRLGFHPDSAIVEITPGGVTAAEVRLAPAAQRIAAVVVEAGRPNYSGRLRSFNERRDRGFGHFFTADDIDRRNPGRVTDLLRMVPGVRVQQRGAESIILMRGRSCPPLIWVDGAPAAAGYLDPDLFTPRSLAGIEVYSGPATVPTELMWLRGKGACGVIALWTRLDDPRGRRPERAVSARELADLVASLRLYTADQVDQPVTADSTALVSPQYPDSLQRAGVSGRVLVEFVVDTDGDADMATFGVVLASNRLFADAVRRAVDRARFTPAMHDGRLVRQLVQLPFQFVAPTRLGAQSEDR